jgi:hypothetical protein
VRLFWYYVSPPSFILNPPLLFLFHYKNERLQYAIRGRFGIISLPLSFFLPPLPLSFPPPPRIGGEYAPFVGGEGGGEKEKGKRERKKKRRGKEMKQGRVSVFIRGEVIEKGRTSEKRRRTDGR